MLFRSSSSQLKAKGELSFERGVPREGGRWERPHSHTHYRDVRRFCSGHHLVRFYFLTRAYSPYVKTSWNTCGGASTPRTWWS